MKKAFLMLTVTLLAQSTSAQTGYRMSGLTATVTPFGQSTMVNLTNGRLVLCGPDGLQATLCSALSPGDPVTFSGKLPAIDSDAKQLGAVVSNVMTVTDGIPPGTFPSTWFIDGCVVSNIPNGCGRLLVLSHASVQENVFCGPSDTLGGMCQLLVVGSCGRFEGSFPAPGSNLFDLALRLRSLAASDVASPPDGGGEPCTDCDGR